VEEIGSDMEGGCKCFIVMQSDTLEGASGLILINQNTKLGVVDVEIWL
jgi:hypothetical protein